MNNTVSSGSFVWKSVKILHERVDGVNAGQNRQPGQHRQEDDRIAETQRYAAAQLGLAPLQVDVLLQDLGQPAAPQPGQHQPAKMRRQGRKTGRRQGDRETRRQGVTRWSPCLPVSLSPPLLVSWSLCLPVRAGVDRLGQIHAGVEPVGQGPQHAAQSPAGDFIGQCPQSRAQWQPGPGQLRHARGQLGRLFGRELSERIKAGPMELHHRGKLKAWSIAT